MRSRMKAVENLVTVGDIWLVNSMCLVVSYLWRRLYGLLYCRTRNRTSVHKVLRKLFDL